MGGGTLKVIKSLHRTFFISLILSTAIPLALVGACISTVLSLTISRDIERRYRNINNVISRQIEQFFTVPSVLLHQIKGHLELQGETRDYGNLNEQISIISESFPFFNQIMILGDKGEVIHIHPAKGDSLGNNLSSLPLFQDSREGDILWSPVYISSLTGQPALTGSIAYSRGVVVGYLDLEYLISHISEIEIEHKGFIIITDKKGTTVIHPDKSFMRQQTGMGNIPLVRAGMNGEFGKNSYDYGGKKYVVNVDSLSQFGWLLFILQEAAGVNQLHRMVGVITIISILTALGLSIFVARYISRHTLNALDLLNRTTREIIKGHYRGLHWKKSYSELDSLAASFEQMIEAVQGREQEISKLQDNLSKHINSMPSLMIGINGAYRITLWNNMIEEFTAIKEQDALDHDVFQFFPPLRAQRSQLDRCLKDGIPSESLKVKDRWEGREYYWDIHIYPLSYSDGWGAGIRLDDVTALVDEEAMVQQSDRLNSLGKLSAGISHDLNNMLTPILGYGELLNPLVGEDAEAHVYLGQIQEAAERAQKLVHQLLVFSKKQNLAYQIFDINEMILDFHKLLIHSIPENISIEYELGKDRSLVNADKGQLEQVIMNLVINGRDAMPHGGEIHIRSDQVYLEEPLADYWDWQGPGPFIRLSIADTGQGMDKDVLKRIFEPFYSTKGKKGSGLGLSMVYGIINQHHGYLLVRSRPDEGSRFNLFFPSARGEERDETVVRDTIPVLGGGETILLVEDDKPVRRLIEIFLADRNYRVLTAGDGIEGREVFRENKNIIKMVLSDIIMPRMNGKDMAMDMREESPSLPLLFMTGYADDILSSEDRDSLGAESITKPFKMDEMLVKIQRILEA